MSAHVTAESLTEFRLVHGAQIARLYHKAAGERWGVSDERFLAALHRSSARRFGESSPSRDDVTRYLESLQVADLVLACACAEGLEPAWEHFVREYRPRLYAAARAIAGEAAGRELADSLYADLYAMANPGPGGARRSLFDYFHGRSSLGTWLRAVLAQRHVDTIRVHQHTEPLGEDPPAPDPGHLEEEPERRRYQVLLQRAMRAAIVRLDPQDRLRLASYYLHGLRLAQIGRMMGEHEATVSRKLQRTRTSLRRAVEHTLRSEQHLSDPQIERCFEVALDDWPFDLSGPLGGPMVGPGPQIGRNT